MGPKPVHKSNHSESSSASTKRASTDKNHRSLSRAMSWALRHSALELDLRITPDGYVPVNDLLNCGHKRFEGWTEDDVRHVVATNDKQRYKLSLLRAGDMNTHATDKDATILCVRANQGHSIPNIDADKLLTRIPPGELLGLDTVVHGTYWKAWRGKIENEGLSRMSRNHIHFAEGTPKEKHVISGMRASCDVFIFIDAARCAREGVEFFKSDNGVLLTAGINNQGILPPEFFSRVVSSSGDELLDTKGTMP